MVIDMEKPEGQPGDLYFNPFTSHVKKATATCSEAVHYTNRKDDAHYPSRLYDVFLIAEWISLMYCFEFYKITGGLKKNDS